MEFLLEPAFLCSAMFLGVIVLLLMGFPVAFSLAGSALLFAFIGMMLGVFDWPLMKAFPQRIFATMRNDILIAVPLFVFMGVMLERSNVAEELLSNMGKLFMGVRGGLGYAVCLVGALLAASTGIVGATVVTMGLLSLPTMLKRGYDPSLACGTICASGTLGQVIPPSIVLVLLGDQLSTAYQQAQYNMGNFAPDSVSVNDLFAGALIPGLVLVALYMLYIFIVSVLKPSATPVIEKDLEELSVKQSVFAWNIIKALFAPLMLIIAVLGSILAGVASPTEAASVGAVGSLMLAGYRCSARGRKWIILALICLAIMLILSNTVDLRMQKDVLSQVEVVSIFIALICSFGLVYGIAVSVLETYKMTSNDGKRVLREVVEQTTLISSMVFGILIGASLFSLVFRGFGGDVLIEEFLHNIPGGTLAVLLVVMITMFLLGFILDFLEIIFIVVPIVAPILLTMEIEPGIAMSPVWLGIMMAVNLQTSFLTPPFGFSLFYLRGVAPASIKTKQIYKGVIPFVLIQIFMLALLWFFPQISTWLPSIIYG